MLFVGTYLDNEVSPDHIIFGFVNMLSHFNVLTTKIRLDGLAESEVNSMISDALGILPRVCRTLSQVVFRKTKGNPYFVVEFLRSLVQRKIVKFCLREKRWLWNEAEVCAENITDNVLYLLSKELNGLSENTQTALKCASCFGIRIDKLIAQKLSAHSNYINLQSALEDAVNGGFMDFDGTHYRFVHD
jgi:predicted ATPase